MMKKTFHFEIGVTDWYVLVAVVLLLVMSGFVGGFYGMLHEIDEMEIHEPDYCNNHEREMEFEKNKTGYQLS